MSNKKHPTKIQGYVRKKVDNNQQQCNSEASEEKKYGEVWYGRDKYVCSSSTIKTWGVLWDSRNLYTFE